MCGIAGILCPPAARGSRAAVERIAELQNSRGPDHRGIETIEAAGRRLVLAHNRLAIVDRSPRSDQPMWDAEHRCCIVFNGEIYNYRELRRDLAAIGCRFSTGGDTEVLVEAFKRVGPRCLERLNGMFAFAMYDSHAGRLYLARDRYGVKPLYYRADGECLWFASTAEPIAALNGLPPDLTYAARGLQYWVYEAGDAAPFVGVKSVPPGHCAVVDMDGPGRLPVRVMSYYDLHDRAAALADELSESSEPELLERLERLLDRAVELRVDSEGPVGISLSGGLDSSTLATLLAAHGRVVGFTYGDPEDRNTEAPVVQKFVKHTGLEVVFVHADAAALAGAYRAAVAAQAAPFPTGSIVAQYLVYRAARERGIRVMLGGQGGDEIFMGYRKYQLFHLRQLIHRRRTWEALSFFATLAPEGLAEMPRLLWYWRLRHRYTRGAGLATALDLPDALASRLDFDPDQPLWIRQLADIHHASLPTLLRYEDRNSMAHSIESRLPYLDYPLVEFALALPISLKLRHGYRKWIMRAFARGRIPEAIRTARYKRSFDVEQGAWVRRGLGRFIRRAVREGLPATRGYLKSNVDIDRLFCDDRLVRVPAAFGEATTLLWLAEVTQGASVAEAASA